MRYQELPDLLKIRYFNEENDTVYDLSHLSLGVTDRLVVIVDELGKESPDCGYYQYNEFKPENLIRCTGLKDKVGNLIYENDILISPDLEDGYYVQVVWFDEEAKFDLYCWNGEEWEYKLSDDEMTDLKYFTIVGNIYEGVDGNRFWEEAEIL